MEGSTRCYETAERSFTYLVRVVTRFHIVVPTNLAVSRCSSRGGAQCSMAAALPCRLYGSKLSAAVELATAIRATSSRSLLPRTAACCNIRQLQTAAGAHSTLHPRSIFVPPISKARSLATSPSARAVEKRPESGRRTLEDLPDKVDVSVGPAGRLSKVIPPRRGSRITTRVGSSYAGTHTFSWISPPSNVLIVKKARDPRATKAMARIISHIRSTYPSLNIILESHVIDANDGDLASTYPELVSAMPADKSLLAQKTDVVITLGGDGSILHVSSLFDRDAVPPVLSFSMGTLGFLLPYDISGYREAIKDLLEGNISLLLRMRLRQTSHRKDGTIFCQMEHRREGGGCYEVHLMNEVTLHRGNEPHMTKIDAYVDGQHLTQAIVRWPSPIRAPNSRRTKERSTDKSTIPTFAPAGSRTD